jgi:hypothetical protein
VVTWIGGRPGESVTCGRSTGVKLVAHRATAPAFVARTSTATLDPAARAVTVRSARPSLPALTVCCCACIADDVASDTCAPLAVWTITWVGAPSFGVGLETVAVHEIGAAEGAVAPVGVGVGVASPDDEGEGDGEGAFKIADDGPGAGLVPAAEVADGVRLAQAATDASAIIAQLIPAARPSGPRDAFIASTLRRVVGDCQGWRGGVANRIR